MGLFEFILESWILKMFAGFGIMFFLIGVTKAVISLVEFYQKCKGTPCNRCHGQKMVYWLTNPGYCIDKADLSIYSEEGLICPACQGTGRRYDL